MDYFITDTKERSVLKKSKEQPNFDLDKIDSRVKHIKVLMYHRIIDEENDFDHWTGVGVRNFENQMKLLEHFGYTPITFNDFRLYLLNRLELPKKPIILTFDDGYKDFFDCAYPILGKYGFKAVIFVLGNRSLKKNIWDNSEDFPSARLLDNEEIIELHNHGFEIGAHSMNHPKLTEITPEKARYEIRNSKILIEDLLEDRVHTFCYPYGMQNKDVQEMVKKAGFTFACSVYTGPHQFGKSFYNIRRLTIKNSTGLLRFALKILAPNEYLKLAHIMKGVKELV